MVPMFASFEWGHWLARSPILNAVWIGIVALLMVSTIPTFSLKRIRIPTHHVIPTLLGVGLMAAFLTTAPWVTLMLVGVVYVGSIPLTVRASHRLRREYQARQELAAEPQTAGARRTGRLAGLAGAARRLRSGAPASEWRHERHTPQEPQR